MGQESRKEERRGRWLLAGIWLVYLFKPLQVIWREDDELQRIVGLVALGAFCTAYLSFFAVVRQQRRLGMSGPLWRRIGYLVVMLVLATAMIPAAGESALNSFVYVVAMAMMTLPLAAGAAVTGVLFITAEVLLQIVPGWHEDGGYGFSIVLAALAVFGLRRAIQRGWELAAARKDFAELRVQEERTRFARDLHDILGHSLTVITVKAELAGKLLPDQPDRAAVEVADVENLARAALADVRAAVAGYRGPSLAGELVSARAALTAAGITPELPTAVDSVPEDRRELFAWVVREGVTNVVKHSKASRCTVMVDANSVEVADDGVGAAASTSGGGHGLVGLRERAAAAGAVLQVGSRPGGGFRLALRMAA
jgi:two-component system, NarL family, sensor histidine kinase DesK